MIRAPSFWYWLRRPPLAFKVTATVLVALCYGAAGFVFFERPAKPELDWLDGFWWAMVTMATVGYGDFFPVTRGGRFLVAYPVILIGLAFLAWGLAQLAGFFLQAEQLNRRGLMMSHAIDHIVICNYPSRSRFENVLAQLRRHPQLEHRPVVLVDERLDELPAAFGHELEFVRGHPARADSLDRANTGRAAEALVLATDPTSPRSDDHTVATCLTLRTLYPRLHIVAECVDPQNLEVIQRAGADSIVCVLGLAPGMLAQELRDPGVVQVLEQLTRRETTQHNLFIVPISFSGERSVADLKRWAETQQVVVLGVRNAERTELNPAGTRRLDPGDAAILLAQARPERLALT